ncbi:MAG: cation transporter [Erythrobacter sp.]|nr:cation transporter [Erythrobacter sp.]
MGHSHSHAHDHPQDHLHSGGLGHGHGHSHAPTDFGRAFVIGIVLNAGFVAVEATYGFLSGSMALVADAGHNLSDVLGLLIAWAASLAAKRPPSARFTYGLKSSTILAAFANAILLLIAVGAILFETVHRVLVPVDVEGMTMIVVAGIGVAINTATALLFMRGRHHDLNIRGAYLHMAADALVSVGVVLAGALILFTGLRWIDPLVSLVIVAVITWGTWGLLRDSVKMGLLGVPDGVDEAAVLAYLAGLPGVAAVRGLHIWPMSTTETALSAHLAMPGGHPGDAFLHDLAEELAEHHHIDHVTVQVETDAEGKGCCV